MPRTIVNSRVTVQIVTWNSLTHVPSCLESLDQQTFQPLRILMIDNGSIDRTVPWLEEHYPQINLLRNTRNTGFSHAHNQGFRITRSDYVVVLNPDVVIAPDWIERGVAWLDAHPQDGTYGGKIRRYEYSGEELKSVVKSDILDTCGLRVSRSRHAVDRGSGQLDRGQFDQAEPVFGHSGACVLYRLSALESIRYQDEFFDEDFFAYKDDVDAAWRLQRAGWTSWYDPGSLAWHHRGIAGRDGSGNLAIAQNHKRRQRWANRLSYRNHWMMLIKNETWTSVWRDLPWIVWYELRKFGWLLISQPSSLSVIPDILRLSKKMKRKAKLIQRTQRVSPLLIRQWFLD
jgi:GT2 family glycosyltransferase